MGKEILKINRGVIQGGVTSPTLFLIMFNDLLVELKRLNHKPFAYVDDLAVIGICKANLIEAINVIEKWTEENKMSINKKKSGIIIHG